jgi:large subunit ribosomal protein L10
MKIAEKNQVIDSLAEQLKEASNIYIADIGDFSVETSNNLRRLCFRRNVKLRVVKNTLLKRAMEKSGKDFKDLFSVLNGPTSVMLSETGNVPAKLIKEFRKSINSPKPILKGAFIEDVAYIGNENLEFLINIKSKNELVGDIILMLQSPARNIISALQSGGHKISGLVKTLSDRT